MLLKPLKHQVTWMGHILEKHWSKPKRKPRTLNQTERTSGQHNRVVLSKHTQQKAGAKDYWGIRVWEKDACRPAGAEPAGCGVTPGWPSWSYAHKASHVKLLAHTKNTKIFLSFIPFIHECALSRRRNRYPSTLEIHKTVTRPLVERCQRRFLHYSSQSLKQLICGVPVAEIKEPRKGCGGTCLLEFLLQKTCLMSRRGSANVPAN